MQHHRNSSALSRLPFIILLSLIALFAACSGSRTVITDTESPKASIKELRDYQITMLDAPSIKLSEITGKNKVVLLNFWATWCGPCRQEIPHLNALQREYQSQGVEIIGLSVEDPRQATDAVRNFARAYEINYQLGFASQEMFAAFNGPDPRMPIPQSFIFGRDGNLVPGGHIKGSSSRIREILQAAIEKALKTTAKSPQSGVEHEASASLSPLSWGACLSYTC
jgi:thiol-disulfide isomerase/thioredoxin